MGIVAVVDVDHCFIFILEILILKKDSPTKLPCGG